MAIRVRYFASLRERLGRGEDSVEISAITSVTDLWARVSGGLPWPTNTLVAVNLEYRDVACPLREGDEVAFFPPVTGG